MTRTKALKVLLGLLITILTIAVTIDTVLVFRLSSNVSNQQQALKTSLDNQVSNRTANVLLWCGAINKLDNTLNAYVQKFSRAPALGLVKLPCHDIANKTKRSAVAVKPKRSAGVK